jgi:hypothetical protein
MEPAGCSALSKVEGTLPEPERRSQTDVGSGPAPHEKLIES